MEFVSCSPNRSVSGHPLNMGFTWRLSVYRFKHICIDEAHGRLGIIILHDILYVRAAGGEAVERDLVSKWFCIDVYRKLG